jgi:CRP/FNR family cyclic AMP-dependent transcriptional regulator
MFQNSTDFLTFEPGQVIFNQDERGDFMYAVLEGDIDIVVGDNKVVDTVHAGGIFGEMALIDDGPRSASARAKTACRVVPVTQRRFTFLVQQTPFFAIEVMRLMSERLRKMLQFAA